MDVRHVDDVGAFTVGHAGFLVGEHDQLAATGTHFLQVGFEFFQQFVVRRNGHHRHVVIHQGQRAVFQLTGRVGFGVDVRDFLEFQRAFHRHRVLRATAEEQGVVFVGKQFGDFFYGAVHGQGFAQAGWQAAQFFDQSGFDAFGEGAANLAQGQGQQQQAHKLGGEGFGGRHADFATGLGQQGQVGLAHQGADADVADGQATEEAQLFGVAQCGQGVGGFAGLGDGHKQGVWLHHHLAVAEFAGDFDLARNAGQFFQPVTGNHTGVIAGATGDNLYIAHFGEQLGRLRAESVDQYLLVTQATFQGALHHGRLLVDFLEHEVAECAFVGSFGAVAVLHGFAFDGIAVDVPDRHAFTADVGDIAFFQVHEAVGDLAQGQLVGGEEVFPQAEADHQRAATARSNHAVGLAGADHGQAIGAVQFLDGGLESNRQVAEVLELVVQQVGDDFGVGVRGEHIAQALELFAQHFVVFDDAVVHHCQVTGEVRVGIALARRPMGGPAGVSNAETADQRLAEQRLLQLSDLARATHPLKLAGVGENRHTGAVVAAIFQALEAFEQDGGDVAFSDCAYNSTHGMSPR